MTSEVIGNGPDLSLPTRRSRDDLDVCYAQLAAEFNSDTANAERRAARDR